MNIEVSSSPSTEGLKAISEGIKSFNQEHTSDEVAFEVSTAFVVFAKDKNGTITGGLRAAASWNYCIIELLWLSEQVRGLGAGSLLMQAAENFAREKGFQYMRTETTSFQAKPFYEKLGYRVFGELRDCPKGHTTYCLVKKL